MPESTRTVRIRHTIAPEFLDAGKPGRPYFYGGIATALVGTYTDDAGVHWLEADADLTDDQVEQLGDEHWPWQTAP